MGEVDVTKLSENQKQFDVRFRNMVGEILDVAEASTENDRQYEKVRKLLNKTLYSYHEEFLKTFVK